MARSRRPQTVKKARRKALLIQEISHAKVPHSFVFARPSAGSIVKQLASDLRHVFEPYTASQLQVNKKNVLKDFITIAGPLNVSHVMYLTHPRPDKLAAKKARHADNLLKKNHKSDALTTEHDVLNVKGGVYLHLVRVPHGPSITFRVQEYSLVKDIFTLVRRAFDARHYTTPPLLAMTGFGVGSSQSTSIKQNASPHLQLLVEMFQYMLPSLNVQKLKLSTVHRVLLLSREVDSVSGNEVIYFRHFHIRIENRSVSKALRRLGVGGSSIRKNMRPGGGIGPGGFGKASGVPSLGKYVNIDDYLTKSNLLTDSGLSDIDDLAEVDLIENGVADELSAHEPGNTSSKSKAAPAHGFHHLKGCRKATIRLSEIGPRMTLKLIKIEEGVNSGCVLYHSWHVKSQLEQTVTSEQRKQKESKKAARIKMQESRRQANEATKAYHRQACLEGMRRAGQISSTEPSTNLNEDNQLPTSTPFDELVHQVSEEDESGDDVMASNNQSTSVFPHKIRRMGKKKNKKKIKISKLHPAYNYLEEKRKKQLASKKNTKART